MQLLKCAILWFLLFIFCCKYAVAQYSLHIIAEVPVNTNETFVAGSFNNWNPGDNGYKLQRSSGNHRELIINNLKAGKYQFKITRGDAATIECSLIGMNIRPREIALEKDTTIQVLVEAWPDSYFSMEGLPDSTLNDAMMSRAGYYLEINLDSSYKYALALYSLSQKLHIPYKEARALDLQAAVFTRQGNMDKALELLFKSLDIKKNLKDSAGGTSFVYSSIARIFEGLQEFSKAKENYLNSSRWLNKTNELYKGVAYASIGKLFLAEGNADSALFFVKKALAINGSEFIGLITMGDIMLARHNYREALENYRAATMVSTKGTAGTVAYTNGVESYGKVAGVFDLLHIKDSAFYFARKAFVIAAKVNNPADIVSASKVLARLFEKEKAFDSAFFYQQLVVEKKDLLFTEEKEKQVHNIYFNETLRLQELAAREEKYRSQEKMYALGGFALLLIVIGIAYRARMKNRFYKQLSQIEMRALRAQMNPHFIFNCLASINRYIVKSDTKTASAYLTKFSRLIRLILDNSFNELISVDAEIQTLKLYLDMESLRFEGAFEYEIVKTGLVRTDNTAIPAMIIQPYIENAIWHGLLHLPADGDRSGRLWLRFIPINDDALQVEIEDNGIGRQRAAELRSKDAIKTKSWGMQISKERLQIINTQQPIKSSVVIEDLYDDEGMGRGTKVTLQLPLIEMAALSTNIKTHL
ncbi:MAG: histidine kinase [Ginsengibacter sp.]